MILAVALALIQYPIATLGGCDSQLACKYYCDIPWHHTVCETWARGGSQVLGEEDIQISYPIPELGNCSSKENCKLYCDEQAHWSACQEWARRQGVGEKEATAPETTNPENNSETETPAISFPIAELGNCGSKEECMAYCEQPEHMEKCLAFARAHGLDKGEPPEGAPKEGPGGCDSPESCANYCEKHAKECYEWAKQHKMGDEQGPPPDEMLPKGPGDCDSPESCAKYCKEHEEDCREFPEAGDGKKEWESSEDNGYGKAGGPGGCQSEEECKKYCQDHPEECDGPKMEPEGKPPEGDEDYDYNQGDYSEESEYDDGSNFPEDHEQGPEGKEDYEYCNQHPEECEGYGTQE